MSVGIATLNINPGDLVVISVSEVRESIVNDMQGLRHLLEAYGIPDPLIILKTHDETIEVLDEEQMRTNGWVRIAPEVTDVP